MSGIDFAVAILAIALVLFTIIYNVRKKRRGESTCGYCKGCSQGKGHVGCSSRESER